MYSIIPVRSVNQEHLILGSLEERSLNTCSFGWMSKDISVVTAWQKYTLGIRPINYSPAMQIAHLHLRS